MYMGNNNDKANVSQFLRVMCTYYKHFHLIRERNTIPESGDVIDSEVRPKSTKSLLKILFCEVGFRAQHEKCGFSWDIGYLFWLRIPSLLLLFLFLKIRWLLGLGKKKRESEGECKTIASGAGRLRYLSALCQVFTSSTNIISLPKTLQL